MAEDATERARRAPDDAFAQGEKIALYAVVSLMQQQAISFDLPLTDVSLDGLDPDRHLL